MTNHTQRNICTGMKEIVVNRYWAAVALCFLASAVLTSVGNKRALRQHLKCSFQLLSFLPYYSSSYPAGERRRCKLHQARLPQLEPLIITSQYQLQQPCADAKTLRGLATLPYLIWARGSETVPYHQPIQSESRDGTAFWIGVQSQHQAVQVTWPSCLASFINNLLSFWWVQYCYLPLPLRLSQAPLLSRGDGGVCARRAKDAIKIAEV